MVISCWVSGCSNRAGGSVKFGFYSIPVIRLHECEKTKFLSEQRRKLWLTRINRKKTPSKHARICSEHFVSGKPSDLFDHTNPDWAPSLKLSECLTPRKSESNLKQTTGCANRRENSTPNCKRKGKAAGKSRFARNEGKTSQIPENLSRLPKRKKQMVPSNSKDEGPDADMVTTVETPCTSKSLVALELENEKLREENEKLKIQLDKQKQCFSFSQISDSPDRVQYFTGLPDVATVLFLESLLSKFYLQYHSDDWTVQIMPLVDQLLLTLMKLRLNCGHIDLATRFNCSTATVTNIFTTIVSALYEILYVGLLENNIPSTAKNQTSLPDCFRPFPNCRIVLDCTEVAVSNTETLDAQCHYKGRTTFKALIGVAPNGCITFASDLYGGSASDKAITADCGLLQQLHPGDMVMADKGFTIWDILPEGVSLNIPSFLVNGQLTQEEVNYNAFISKARIHVERSIQRLKSFHILDHIPYQFKQNINKILKVCVCLTNLQTHSL